MLHGLLHLAGYDHESDVGEMAVREEQLRRRFRLPSALIARSGNGKRLKEKSVVRKSVSHKRTAKKRAGRP
jgi:probable rRNA maturation factor